MKYNNFIKTNSLFNHINVKISTLQRLNNFNSQYYKEAKKVINKYSSSMKFTSKDIKILENYISDIMSNEKLFEKLSMNTGTISYLHSIMNLITTKIIYYNEITNSSLWDGIRLLQKYSFYPMINSNLITSAIMGLFYEFSDELKSALALLQDGLEE